MKAKFEDIFIKNYPTLDLHGYDRDTAALAIKDFIKENIKLSQKNLVIIHGIGSGIIKKVTHDTLSNHKSVEYLHLHGFNSGMTIVKLK